MDLNPYLTFDGQCESAFKFYAEVFGGTIEAMIPHEGSPAAGQVPADWQKKIMHARLTANGKILMGSDSPPGQYQPPQGISVSVNVTKPEEADRIFNALAKNGTVRMPIQKTFWALRFGMLIDPFGVPWMVNCEQPA